MNEEHPGLHELFRYPLFSAIFNRRSRRVSTSVETLQAENLTLEQQPDPQPLSPLEEAVLILATGITGIPLPDFATRSADGTGLVGHPIFNALARATSSVDNAQAAHFFLLNDSGTYFLKRPDEVDPYSWADGGLTPEKLVEYAEKCKVQLFDKRIDFPRRSPYYLGPNLYVSNLPGTTVLVPVVDVTRQYINGLMFLLGQPDGERPALRDDWNLYRYAGVRKWVRKGYLNKAITVPMSYLGTFRTDVEAYLIIQNLLLVIQAMGLGGWVHAAFPPPALLGSDDFAKDGRGLEFRYEKSKNWFRRLLFFLFPLQSWSPNPVGIDGLLEAFCPPYYENMDAAVDAILDLKFRKPDGVYTSPKHLNEVLKPGEAEPYLKALPHDSPELIECVKDICNYIYRTYGKFPGHVDAMWAPGVWVQAHHLDLDYYDKHFKGDRGYTETQANHDKLWHGSESSEK